MDINLSYEGEVHTYVIEGVVGYVISKMPKLIEKKKVYENTEKKYDINRGKYIICNWQTRHHFPVENIRYKVFNMDELYKNMCTQKKEYDDAFNSLISYLNRFTEEQLKYIMNYLDIEIDSGKTDNKGGALILESIINDFEILEKYQLQLSQNAQYKGTISLMETLVNQIRECETKIEKHDDYEKKLGFLSIEYLDNYALIEEKENRKKQLESFFVNKLIKRDELEDLKFSLKSLYLTRQNILTEFDLYVNAVKILLNEKNELCLKCIKNKLCIDLILDRLGEKSLRQLITNLNIVIPRSDDNYFNGKEEMKKLLKNWFEETLKQMIIENKLENSEFKEYIQINGDLSINKKFYENEKQLIKK